MPSGRNPQHLKELPRAAQAGRPNQPNSFCKPEEDRCSFAFDSFQRVLVDDRTHLPNVLLAVSVAKPHRDLCGSSIQSYCPWNRIGEAN